MFYRITLLSALFYCTLLLLLDGNSFMSSRMQVFFQEVIWYAAQCNFQETTPLILFHQRIGH